MTPVTHLFRSIIMMLMVFVLSGCPSRKTLILPSIKSQYHENDECLYRDEVCAEATEFQKVYNTLPDEEKKDMKPVLNTYITHCMEAVKQCEKSTAKK